MTTFTLENAFDMFTGVNAAVPDAAVVVEKQEILLSADIEELSSLRFSIVITAKWESSRDIDPRRRKELHRELETLRWRYFEKIDHIAMAFGVVQAIKAKDEVERRVTLPLRERLPLLVGEEDGLSF